MVITSLIRPLTVAHRCVALGLTPLDILRYGGAFLNPIRSPPLTLSMNWEVKLGSQHSSFQSLPTPFAYQISLDHTAEVIATVQTVLNRYRTLDANIVNPAYSGADQHSNIKGEGIKPWFSNFFAFRNYVYRIDHSFRDSNICKLSYFNS
jgi:hypothetical protein